MYTANTMASAIEALGMSLPGSSAQNAVSNDKREDCEAAGAAVLALLERDIKPSDIMTREAFENAITVVIALGGSTNAVLHLIGMARTVGVELALEDFTRIGKRVPVVADLRPSGHYMMSELVAIGGIQPLMKTLLDAGLLHGDCLTVTGKTLAENLASVAPYPDDQTIIAALDAPLKAESHLRILFGNLAPEGAMAKITGKEGTRFSGTARVFGSEEEAQARINDGTVTAGDVVVIRYEGPRGGPGMREMLTPTSAIMGRGLGDSVALITDGGLRRRPARPGGGWRSHHHRRRGGHHPGRPLRRGACAPPRRLAAAGAALRSRCAGQVREDRQLRQHRGGHRRLRLSPPRV